MTATPSNSDLEQRIADIEKRLKGDESLEKSLTETEQKLAYLVEISMDPIVVTDRQGNIEITNNAFLKMVGYPEQ